MADLDFVQPEASELRAFVEPIMSSFGMDGTDDDHRFEELTFEVDRAYGARDGDEWVGGSGAYSFQLTVPGARKVAAAGITMVGVSPTHRRRGILTEMLRWQHDDARRRGDLLAILTASESSIYRRFGYGVATDVARVRIPSRAVVLDPPAAVGGRFRRIDPATDTSPLAAVYDAARTSRVAWFDRHAGWWERLTIDPPHHRDGASKLCAVLHEDDQGDIDGYATYRVRSRFGDNRIADDVVELVELVGLTTEVELGLWELLASIDLATSISWNLAPAEMALRWRLVEPRQLHQAGRSDWMWVHVLDVAGALAARRYAATDELVLEVTGSSSTSGSGTFRLEGGPGHATCERAEGAAPDLTLAAPELGAVYLGGVSPTVLAAAGRLVEHTPGALARADALFGVHPLPHCPLMF